MTRSMSIKVFFTICFLFLTACIYYLACRLFQAPSYIRTIIASAGGVASVYFGRYFGSLYESRDK